MQMSEYCIQRIQKTAMSSQEGIKNLLGTKRKGLQLAMIGKVSPRDPSILILFDE